MKLSVVLRASSVAAIILFVLVLNVFPTTNMARTVEYAAAEGLSVFAVSDAEIELFRMVNAERAKYRLAALEWDDKLGDLARDYSEQMADEDFFAHEDPSGDTVVDRARRKKIRNWRKIGENLFMSSGIRDFKRTAIRGWMRSTGHRQNILDPAFNMTGIGVARTRDGSIYVTQIFIRK